MTGNDRVRFCSQCSLNVFNLSAMTTQEAEDLLRRTEGQLCVRFYRRSDGTILTKNCPVGLQAIRDRLTRIRTGLIAAILSFVAHLGLVGAFRVFDYRLAGEATGVHHKYEQGGPRPTVPLAIQNPSLPIIGGPIVGPGRSPNPSFPGKGERYVRPKAANLER
jgi:hypothetical protein